jgi:CheY-like chemotaxis protein
MRPNPGEHDMMKPPQLSTSVAEVENHGPAPAPVGHPQGLADVPAHQLLVVDDDDAIREVAQMALEIVGGFEVRTASSGGQAWDMVRLEAPDALLLDVMMPGMDGPTLLSHLRTDPVTSHIPIIFLTAKIQAGDRRDWNDLDIAGVIAKPFDPMKLADDISRLLGWSS